MPTEEVRSTGLMVIGLSLAVIIASMLMHLLPLKVAVLLIAWSLLSVPVGIAIGHCALSED